MGTVVKSCRLIEETAGKGADRKPLLETVAQALDKENEGLRLAFGTDDFRKALKAKAEKRLPAF
jgi:hypothetical protein